MDDFKRLYSRAKNLILLILLVDLLFITGTFYLEISKLKLNPSLAFSTSILIGLIIDLVIYFVLPKILFAPLKAIWQTIIKISPTNQEFSQSFDLKTIKLGRDLVSNLINQIYQLINLEQSDLQKDLQRINSLDNDYILNNLPLPLLVLDNEETIKFANHHFCNYLGLTKDEITGKSIYSILDMSFISDNTFDVWLKKAKSNSAFSEGNWNRVKLAPNDKHPTLYFDLTSFYNLGNTQGNTTILVFYDHSIEYAQDDQSISFVALAVHELRTPLTLLKGYIEVFTQELSKIKLDPELASFLDKMRSSLDQLNAFVNNILNVTRIDNDQMFLKLQKQNWSEVITQSIQDMKLRAKVRDIKLNLIIEKNIPEVALDRISIQEVVYNLLDNAIKYSQEGKEINIHTFLNQENMVETTVQDFGRGIPDSIVENLFSKFYRDHHNRAQVGGTGLGLYISKSIVNAHHGNIWVHSKEGQGSTFGFTLLPFDQLSESEKNQNNNDLVQTAHGWIKNHSYYRR